MSAEALLLALQRRGIATAQQLMADLSISQPTFSRVCGKIRDDIVTIGRGRGTRYALRSRSMRLGSEFPIYRIGDSGQVSPFGDLIPLLEGRFLLGTRDGVESVFEGLPWFVWDMRPQGFLGRLFARRERDLGLPADPRDWSDEDILIALSRRGEDYPGDLIVGKDALDRYLDNAMSEPRIVSRGDYPALALAALQGELAGSSAGGEQPKFNARVQRSDEKPNAVLVKFSPPSAESPAARRWADLLHCEHLALSVLRDAGEPAAVSRLVEAGGRMLLEIERFDRPARGRRALISGLALDMEFVGGGNIRWPRLGEELVRQNRLDARDAKALAFRHLFGRLIGNTDMHLGNVSFFTEDYRHFLLAPAYDMLPMALAPTGRGEILDRPLEISPPTVDDKPFWPSAAASATEFWTRVAGEPALEERLTPLATAACETIGRMDRRMKLLR